MYNFHVKLQKKVMRNLAAELILSIFLVPYSLLSEIMVLFYPILYKKLSRISIYLYRNVEFATRENCLPFCFGRFGELGQFNTSTPSESTVAPKLNLTRLGSAHEWSGV